MARCLFALALQLWLGSALKDATKDGPHEAATDQAPACPPPPTTLTGIEDLGRNYCNIFPSGNRNAASFRWFKFIADRAAQMDVNLFEELSKGYCPISGSPIAGTNQARVKLNKVGGGQEEYGSFYFCCDPCICDMVDLVKMDTKTLTFSSQTSKQYKVLVHGDPCKDAAALDAEFTDPFSGANESLRTAAPDVTCQGDALDSAVFSDGGYPIIGVFFDDPGDGSGAVAEDTTYCQTRAGAGYNSGMGLIFRKVAEITPIS
eukprot:TRINITY_DN11026_c0_g1_i1.p1 TRINITY_DN11026_c0_g1~~TRINITY_DN11026_c0_g1_i1.p1  ORF type:complete len:261 (+),score=54.18 TRINITY_DN11026_c0_g1_i1:117-899(+)